MKDSVIKQVPKILEYPILVMRFLTDDSRLTLFGEVYDTNNVPVLAVLELNAKSRKRTSVDVIKIASAYGKDNNLQSFIDRSQILYIDPNKKRTHSWFVVNRLKLPLLLTNYGFVNSSLSQNDSGVNKSLPKKTADSEIKYSLKQTDSEGTELSAENPDIRYSRKARKKYVNPYENWHGVDNEGHFVPGNENGGSDASEQAFYWVARENVADGDLWLAPGLGSCYIIERMKGDDHGYKVVEKIEERDREYEKRRIEEHNRANRGTGLERNVIGYNNFNTSGTNAAGDERHDSDVSETGHQTKSRQIRSVDRTPSEQRKARIESGQNTFGGDENRAGNGTERLTDSEEKKSRPRHSLGIADSAAKQSLVAQNKAFRRIISEQQRVLNRHFVDAQKLKTLARVIKQDYRSTIDAAELTAMLGEAYTGMANGKTISPDVVSTQMRAIAEKVISTSKNLTEPSERSKEIIKDIRSVAVNLSDKQRAEVAHNYGSYNDFKRSAFGALTIRNDGIGLDSRYSELAKTYPEFFPADVAEPDQPMVLFEAVKALKNGYLDENGFDYDSAVDYLAGIKDLTPGIRAPGVCFLRA